MAVKRKSTAVARSAKKGAARRSPVGAARAKAPDRGPLNLDVIAPSLTVNDITQSLAWYCDVLGFAVKERWERDGKLLGAEVRAGRTSIYLGQDDWKKGRDRVKGEGFRIYCETSQDIDRLAAAIKARGGTLGSEPRDEWGTRAFDLEDPSGYKITISSDR